MEKLICGGNEIEVQDFLIQKRICSFDAKFKTEKEFEHFLNIYKECGPANKILKFEICGNCLEGWFGAMLYDKDYNVRFYIGIYGGEEEFEQGGKIYGIPSAIIGVGNAIRELCSILKEKNVLIEQEERKIIEAMNVPETKIEFSCFVEDLPLYLKSTHSTLEDLKNE